jgi:hypothetical protein
VKRDCVTFCLVLLCYLIRSAVDILTTVMTLKNVLIMGVYFYLLADTCGRAVYQEGLLPLAFWDCGVRIPLVLVWLSLVNFVFFQVEIPVTYRSLV